MLAYGIQARTNSYQENQQKKLFVLAGGSNMLLTKDIDALVLHINNKGIEVIDENDDLCFTLHE